MISDSDSRRILDNLAGAVLAIDRSGRIVYANQAIEALLGWPAGELIGKSIGTLRPGSLRPGGREIFEQMLRTDFDSFTAHSWRAVVACRNGDSLEIDSWLSMTTDDAGEVLLTAVVARSGDQVDADVFDREHAARTQAEQAEAALRSVIRASPLPILQVDTSGNVTSWNPAAHLLLGWTEEEVMGSTPPFVLDGGGDELYDLIKRARRWESPTGVEMRKQKKDGSWIDLSFSAAPLFDRHANVGAVMIVLVDITQRKRAEAALHYQAVHDALTDLPNRVLLFDRLRQAIATAVRDRSQFALFIIDLDRFKEVNDTHGHPVGDELLQATGHRLSQALRESDTVARLGGDEFAVLLPGVDPAGAEEAATKLGAVLAQPFEIDGHQFVLSSSIGAALFPRHGRDIQTLMRRADIAMYVAKRGHQGYAAYDPSFELTGSQNTPRRRGPSNSDDTHQQTPSQDAG